MRTLFNALLLVLVSSMASYGIEEGPSEQSTIYWESSQLAEAKNRTKNPDEKLEKILVSLRKNADEALTRGPYSVTFKEDVPPSGDKHDYMSFSRYWWPNPDTPDGLPYVRHDGRVNADLRRRGDRDQIGQLFEDIDTLSLAYYFLEEEKYATHAVKLVRTWFLDPKTKMNPHLEYGQAVPGLSDGRGVGIIDTRGFITLLDSLSLLSSSDAFEPADHQQLQQWFSDYLKWLLTSNLGKEEAGAENNHGSWYAAQTSRIAMFVGETTVARDIVEQVVTQRIPRQFLPDGRQPAELARTRSLSYSFFNLEALSVVARVGEHLGIDLWQAPPQGVSLHSGLQFLLPYSLSEKEWPFPQIEKFSLSGGTVYLLRMASFRYDDPAYLRPIAKFSRRHSEYEYADLLFRIASQPTVSPDEVEITISEDAPPARVDCKLPDISGYSVEKILSQVPLQHTGTARIGPTEGEPILEETFRKDRRKGFQERQGTKATRVIKLQGGPITLEEIARQLDDETVLSIDDETATLRLPILVDSDATLIVDGKVIHELRLSTDRGTFIANAGSLYIVQTKVTSWDEQNSAASSLRDKTDFRPYISSYIRSQTYLAGNTFHDLGYHAATSYGISVSSHPERNDPSKIKDWPTGVIIGNEFHGLYYGFYSFEARGVKIIDNKYVDCILYGIDPHDRSTELVIARNTTTGTRERHGIIGSRGISNSYIFDNTSYGNFGSGIMLDRQCSGNVICENKVFSNGQGVAIYESPSNIIADNLIVQNKRSGIRVRNSNNMMVVGNEIVANGDYGLEVYSKRLDDHKERADRGDTYDQTVSVSFFDNVVAGNQGGVIKGQNVSHLLLSRVDTNPDMTKIEAETGLSEIALETDDDHTFGNELKRHSVQLKRVFDENMPLVEFRRKMFDRDQ